MLWPSDGRSDTSTATPRAGAISEIRFWTTPGKPMPPTSRPDPAERVVARREGGRFTLIVSRNVGEPYVEARAELGEAEWRRLLDLVAAHSLVSWKPQPSGGSGNDFSTSGFALQGADGKSINEQEWSRPIRNAADPATLGYALGRLAKAKVAKPVLFYFGS